MKKITLFITAALVSSTALFAQNSNSINLKKGQKYSVQNVVSTKSTTEMQGQSMEANVDATTFYNIEVKDVAGDNYNLTNTVTGVKMSMSQMGQEMQFDSEKKEDLDGPIGGALKEYINQPKSVVVDKSGKVVPQASPEKPDTAAAGAASMFAKQLGNFEATGYGSGITFEPLPKDVKVGSTWSKTTTNEGVTTITNYVVKSISGDVATLTTSGTLTTDTKMEMQGMEITTKTAGKFSGEELVDVKTGVVQSNTSTFDTSGTIGVMGQELPTSAKVTTTTTVKVI